MSSLLAKLSRTPLLIHAPGPSLGELPEDIILQIVSYLGRRPNPEHDVPISRNNAAHNVGLIALTRTSRSMHALIQPRLLSLLVPPLLRPLQDNPMVQDNLKNKLIFSIRLGDVDGVQSLWDRLRKDVHTSSEIAQLVSAEAAPIRLLCMFERACSAGCRPPEFDGLTRPSEHDGWPEIYALSGLTIAHVAAYCGQDKILKIFLNIYPQLTHQKDCRGLTPLFHATHCGQAGTIHALLDHDADILAFDGRGNETTRDTPLTRVLHYGDPECGVRSLDAMITYRNLCMTEIDTSTAQCFPKVLLCKISEYMDDFINGESMGSATPLSLAMLDYLPEWEWSARNNIRQFGPSTSLPIFSKKCSQRKEVVERLLGAGASPHRLCHFLSKKRDIAGHLLVPIVLEKASILNAAKYKRADSTAFAPAESLAELDALIALMEKPSKKLEPKKKVRNDYWHWIKYYFLQMAEFCKTNVVTPHFPSLK